MARQTKPIQTTTTTRSHLVGPLSHSYAAAGFFPKSSELEMLDPDGRAPDGGESSACETLGERKNSSDGDLRESVFNQTKYWLIDDSSDGRKKLNKQFLDCIQTMNLRNNFLYWDAKSKEKQQPQQ